MLLAVGDGSIQALDDLVRHLMERDGWLGYEMALTQLGFAHDAINKPDKASPAVLNLIEAAEVLAKRTGDSTEAKYLRRLCNDARQALGVEAERKSA